MLYTHDFEPITVLQLTPWMWDHLWKHRAILLAVTNQRVTCQHTHALPSLADLRASVVHITADHLIKGEHETLMLFAADEENALLLRCAFLPGQLSAVMQERFKGMAEGFLLAMNNWRPQL